MVIVITINFPANCEKKFVFFSGCGRSSSCSCRWRAAAKVGAVLPFHAGRLSACARRVQQTSAAAVAFGRSVHVQILARCNVRAHPTAVVPTVGRFYSMARRARQSSTAAPSKGNHVHHVRDTPRARRLHPPVADADAITDDAAWRDGVSFYVP